MMYFETQMKKAALTVAIALSAALPQAFAGDGRGVSGPDLSGSALPIAVDRQVIESEIRHVSEKCNDELTKKLLKMVYGEPDSEHPSITSEVTLNGVKAYYWEAIHGTETKTFQYIDLTLSDLGETRLKVLPRFWVSTINDFSFPRSAFLDELVVLGSPNLKMPSLQYETFTADYVYDELGSEVSHETYVRNLRLINSKQTPVRFRNLKTGVESRIVVDLRPYAECLVDGIQSGRFSK